MKTGRPRKDGKNLRVLRSFRLHPHDAETIAAVAKEIGASQGEVIDALFGTVTWESITRSGGRWVRR